MSLIPPPKAFSFMPASDGGNDFGYIDETAAKLIGVSAGPVRLQVGFPGPKGWGASHLLTNTDRIAHIKEMGFKGVAHFVETVARNYEQIADGGDERLALVHAFKGADRKIHDLIVVVMAKLYEGQTIWSVTTGIVKRVSRKSVLYKCPEKKEARTERSEPSLGDVSNRPRRETLSLPKIIPRDGKGS